jgi:hypothetical protein
MELLIRTKNSLWEFSFRKGLRRANTLNWDNARATFESLIAHQTAKAIEDNQAPVMQAIDETVATGAANAPKNDSNWRKQHLIKYRQESAGMDTSFLSDESEVY